MSDDKKRIQELEAEVASLKSRKVTVGQLNRMRRARKQGLVLVDGKVTYELQPEEKESKRHHGWDHPDNDLVWDPGPKQRIPKEGAWVMITRALPSIERGLDRNLLVGRIFWAEHQPGADEFGFNRDGLYKIVVKAPWGDVCLWPYEYSRMEIPEILLFWQGGEMTFVPVNVELARFNDVVFYARQRGIGLADAMVMALGTIQGPVGWFKPSTLRLQVDMMVMERRVHRWKPRRKNPEPMNVNLEIP